MKTSANNKDEAGFARAGVRLLVAALLLVVATSAWAGKGNANNPGVMPPQSKAFGKTYGE